MSTVFMSLLKWIGAVVTLLASTCAAAGDAGWAPSSSLITGLEAHLILPEGSQPMESYGRYYYGRMEGDNRVLVGEFVLGASPGVHIVSPTNVPKVLDGGCSVINLVYDPANNKVKSLFCNGSG